MNLNSFFVTLVLLLAGCGQDKHTSPPSVTDTLSCKGVYYERDSQGRLKKFNQYYLTSLGACVTDSVPLNQWEKTSELWDRRGVNCVTQPGFASRSLISANNYYAYRDGKIYFDFNSATGVRVFGARSFLVRIKMENQLSLALKDASTKELEPDRTSLSVINFLSTPMLINGLQLKFLRPWKFSSMTSPLAQLT